MIGSSSRCSWQASEGPPPTGTGRIAGDEQQSQLRHCCAAREEDRIRVDRPGICPSRRGRAAGGTRRLGCCCDVTVVPALGVRLAFMQKYARSPGDDDHTLRPACVAWCDGCASLADATARVNYAPRGDRSHAARRAGAAVDGRAPGFAGACSMHSRRARASWPGKRGRFVERLEERRKPHVLSTSRWSCGVAGSGVSWTRRAVGRRRSLRVIVAYERRPCCRGMHEAARFPPHRRTGDRPAQRSPDLQRLYETVRLSPSTSPSSRRRHGADPVRRSTMPSYRRPRPTCALQRR